MRATLPDEVACAISLFAPTSVSAEAAGFARVVVMASSPQTVARSKALLFAASKLAEHCCGTGTGLAVYLALSPPSIEHFVARGCGGMSAATRRTIRSNLRFIASSVLSGTTRAPAMPRGRAKAPYTTAEIDAYLALARSQPTQTRRMRASGLVCLGAGAGLVGEDLRSVRGEDVRARSGGLVVVVSGRRARVVPVLSRYVAQLDESARFAGSSYVTGGADPRRHNLTTPLISALSGGTHLARLDTGRLRSSWLAACASEIGLAGFMSAAGIACTQRLGDIVAWLEPLAEEELVALLTGS
ncbi:MAG: hypothetical protein ACRDZP_09470 [Acidimicrobiales bacterium]